MITEHHPLLGKGPVTRIAATDTGATIKELLEVVSSMRYGQ
jgi:hypothetical protein